jgi:hypothetical protein
VRLVEDTAARLTKGSKVSGWPTLVKLLGAEGEGVVGRVQEVLGIDGRTIAATYDYCDEAGCLRFQVVRFEPKDFKQRRPGGNGGWIWDLRSVVRLLYRLPELGNADPSATVYIPEGEKDVDALRALGLVATCNPMGAGKWQEGFSGPLRNRHVVILPDNDDKGREHARRVAQSLSGVAASVKVLELPGLADAGDVSDWLDAGGTAEELQRLAAEAAEPGQDSTPAAATEPVLPVDPHWPAPLAEEALHGLAGDIVRTLGPASEADPAALLVQLLVGFGNVIGADAHSLVEDDVHAAHEFVVLVGQTSKGRKGTSWGRIRQLLAAIDPEWAQRRVQSGLSSGEGLVWLVRDGAELEEPDGAELEEPDDLPDDLPGRRRRGRGRRPDPGISDKRLLVYEPEFANVLKQADRHGNILSAALRQAWDSGTLQTLTKHNPARATGAHVSLICHITRQELRRLLSATETANGFGNRFLWLCVRRSKVLPEGGACDHDALADCHQRLQNAVAIGRMAACMHRDGEARELWREIYGPLSEGRPGLTGALLSRAEAHVLRLSMLYALLDESDVVGLPHLEAALAVWQYVEQSALHIWGDRLGDPVADELLLRLRSSPAGLTRNQLMDSFGRNQPSDRIGRALDLLQQHRLARYERQETGGRPTERWFAVTVGR